MAKNNKPKEEKNTSTQVVDPWQTLFNHYSIANSELTTRISHAERGFDVYDRVYRNFIDSTKWPFNARVPDGRGYSLLKRKTDRILASRLQGTLIPRKDGTELGARIGTELILYQWNEVDYNSDEPMLMRWKRVDQNARKYGAGFGFCSWRIIKDRKNNVLYAGPWFEVLPNRDVLLQPGATSISDSEWIQIRRYPTIGEMKTINDIAKTGPIYDVETIKELEKSKGDSPANNYTSVNKSVIGLSNTNQDSERIEVITEYNRRTGKWITFLPTKGGDKKILRNIDNPYNHGDIPIIPLVYDKIDDDIYGVPELEAALPLVKTSWALLSQYIEGASSELYTPIMVNPLKVQLDTLEFKQGARWLMEKPGADVVPFQGGSVGMQKFADTFGIITSLIMEAVGETAQDVSNISQKFGDKTATEVRDLAQMRTARDNSNKTILSFAMAKMVYYWLQMDKQFMSGQKIVEVVGKDAIKYFIDEGLHEWTLTEAGMVLVSETAEEKEIGFEEAYNELLGSGMLDKFSEPKYPITSGNETLPKLKLDSLGKSGFLTLDKSDFPGNYDFLVDIEAMSMPNDQAEVAGRKMVFDATVQVKDDLAQQGIRVKWDEMLAKIGESARLKDMEQYFEKGEVPPPTPPQEGMPPGEMPPQAGGPQETPPGANAGAPMPSQVNTPPTPPMPAGMTG